MGKQKKRYLQRILCGMLVSAMIATSLIVPDMTALAASADGIETAAAENDGQSEETPKNQGGGLKENPDSGIDEEGVGDASASDDAGDGPDADVNPEGGADNNDVSDREDDVNQDNKAEGQISAEKKPVKNKLESRLLAAQTERAGSKSITFFYYSDVEVGLYLWGDKISTSAETADWYAWAEGDVKKMTPVEGYTTGWYSVPITFEADANSSNSGFNIIKKSKDSGGNEQKDFETGKDEWSKGLYDNDIIGGADTEYAMKNWKLYKGASEVTAVLRDITFYAYSESGAPAFYLEGTDFSTLTKIDESGTISDIESGGTNKWSNAIWPMTQEEGNWYKLSFVVPGNREFDSGSILKWSIKENNEYGWTADFTNGTAESSIDFTPVFAGKVYYKDGKFFMSKQEAEGITLGQLKELIESDKVKKIIENGESYYTEETWSAFSTAKTNAETAKNNHSTEADSYIADDIKEAYIALEDAVEKMKSAVEKVVTLYFYTDELTKYEDTDTEKHHLYMSTWNKNKIAADKEEITLSQGTWNYTAYLFDEVTDEAVNMGYTNWYSIPVKPITANDGSDGDGFLIQIGKEVTAADHTVTHEALKENDGLITLSSFDKDGTKELYGALVNLENSGSIAIKDGKAFESIQAAEVKTKEQLQELVDAADKLKETGFSEGWAAFQTALAAAKTALGKADATPQDYTTAYDALKEAMDALVPLGTTTTLYYYVGETEDEIGLYHWDDSEGKVNLTSTADPAGWQVLAAGDTYLMNKVAGYAGWYSIPITFQNGGANAGFQIFTKTAAAADGTKKTPLFKCDAGTANHPEIYAQLTSGKMDMLAVKNDISYAGAEKTAQIMRNVTLHIYNEGKAPYLQIGKDSSISVVDEATGETVALTAETVDGGNGYALIPHDQYANWYSLSVSLPGNVKFDSNKICNLYVKDGESSSWFADLLNGAVPSTTDWSAIDITPVFSGQTYYKGGAFYATLEEADPNPTLVLTKLQQLQKLIDEAKKLKQEDYKKGWAAFQTALAAAEAVVKASQDAETDTTKTPPTDEEIEKAYKDLQAAIDALVSKDAVESTVNVAKIALTDDFITGADLSSYLALRESGTVFKDEQGNPLSDAEFFRYLHDGGTNWVRIRIWNNPYDSSGRGYGGGNNDLEKAKTIGKLASDAGMKVLIDFHYSDFWADPAKQQAPKAWKAYSLNQKIAAVESYTLESLNALKSAGVNVGMVQVGNETNNAICGETSRENIAKIFNAGSKAVRAFDPACLVALHFTNPEKGGYHAGWAADLKKYEVDYDVFATSYYPFWHGTTQNLEEVLTYIAKEYGKKVMVAETSWTTSWDDGDGHENTAPRTSQALDYEISLQGQANEIRDVINAVNNVNTTQPGKAAGVFYWEPAWISPYYVYDEDGKVDEKLFKQNQEAWEKYGSGWAASYASEYDPDDAGKWYGGSAVDNQSWFDFDGTALATAKIYSLIRTGAVAERAISSIGIAKEQNPLQIPLGGTVEYPKAVATYNDGTTAQMDVLWEEDEKDAVNTNKVGEYVVHGTVREDGREYKLTLTVKVVRAASANILKNPGMETGASQADWKVSGPEGFVSTKDSDWMANPRTGTYAMNFWSENPAEFTVSQTVMPEAGTYTFGGYIQGDGAGTEDVQYAFVEVSGANGNSRRQTAFTLNGWRNWSNPEIAEIAVEKGDSVTVGVTIKATETGTSGIWGSLDDFYLYGTHDVSVAERIEHGRVETSVVRATGGEKVIVTVTPDEGYYPETLTICGNSITAENLETTLTSVNGTVAFKAAADADAVNAAVLTYAAKAAETKSDTFTMPSGNVTVGATFKSIFDEAAGKIALDKKDSVTGKYLVQVNSGESDAPDGENPIPAQFHTGKDVKPAVTLSYQGYQLTTADYTVSYENNKNITAADSKAKITLTAKGEKFEGTRVIDFEIKEDNRNEFSAKKLKVVFEASDKNGRTDKAAQAVYYLGKEKEIEPKISLYKSTDDISNASKAIDPSLYKVYYQSNKKVGKATLVVLPTDKALNDPSGFKEGSITTNFTIAKCPVNQGSVQVAVSEAKNYYTGKKVEPAVTVTYTYTDQTGEEKTVKLAKGTDYAVAYTNNVNASVYQTAGADGAISYTPINANKVPTVKITGKGNFAGTRTTADLVGTNNKPGTQKFTFQIMPRDLGSLGTEAITAADLAESTKAQAPKITVKDGAKKVAASQYEITEIKLTHDADGNALAADAVQVIYSKANGTVTGIAKVKDAGTYEVTIAGKAKANYEGTAKTVFRVADKDHLISNAKITVNGKFYYTGAPIELKTVSEQQGVKPELQVSFGTGKTPTVLSEKAKGSAEDGYYVSYTNNANAGRAAITITGTGKYIGTKTAAFTINKRVLASTVKENEMNKKGVLQTPRLSAKKVADRQDGTWTPSAENSGVLINTDNTAKTEYGSLTIPYTGYTLNPEFIFSSKNGNTARAEVTNQLSSSDYTVTYAIGSWTDGKAPVTATIKGKGNYSGTVKLQNLFTVTARSLKDFSIDVSPVTYSGKALKPAVTFRDKTTGKTVDLKLNTAYSVSYKNNKDIFGVSRKQPKLTVKVKGKGWITNKDDKETTSRELNFTINQAEITKANVGDVAFQTFRSKALKPKVTIKVNGRKLKEGKDYELTYDKNAKRSGTATATIAIRGKGNYFTRNPIVKTFVIK